MPSSAELCVPAGKRHTAHASRQQKYHLLTELSSVPFASYRSDLSQCMHSVCGVERRGINRCLGALVSATEQVPAALEDRRLSSHCLCMPSTHVLSVFFLEWALATHTKGHFHTTLGHKVGSISVSFSSCSMREGDVYHCLGISILSKGLSSKL